MIFQVAEPQKWARWPQAEKMLEPAKELGDFKNTIERHEALLVVFDRGEMVACATVWQGEEHFEVKLIGGRNHRKWIRELDEVIGAAAKRAGARRLVAIGRRGWMRSIQRLGWVKHSEADDMWVFVKELERG